MGLKSFLWSADRLFGAGQIEPIKEQGLCRETTQVERARSLRANIDEPESVAIITERGGQENHRERSQNGSSFCSQFA